MNKTIIFSIFKRIIYLVFLFTSLLPPIPMTAGSLTIDVSISQVLAVLLCFLEGSNVINKNLLRKGHESLSQGLSIFDKNKSRRQAKQNIASLRVPQKPFLFSKKDLLRVSQSITDLIREDHSRIIFPKLGPNTKLGFQEKDHINDGV